MSTLLIARRSPATSRRRTTLVAFVTVLAIAAVIVLAAVLVSLHQPAGYGRVPHPEPAPTPVPPR
jgi:hypothetical protein